MIRIVFIGIAALAVTLPSIAGAQVTTPAESTTPVLATPTPQQRPCAAAPHRQFDFWVGEWDVYPNGADQMVAHSVIESLYDGCAIRENWMPLKGAGGGSLNLFDRTTKAWRQTWVDNNGSRVDFSGNFSDGVMELVGEWAGMLGPDSKPLVRMRYTRQTDGSVRQLGEQSVDDGATWQPNFDFIYRRRSAPLP